MSTSLTKSPSPDVDLSKLDRDTILRGVDEVVSSLYATGNIPFVVSVLNAFEKFQDISGFARAKLLWGAQDWFAQTQQTGDFYEKFGVTEKNERTYADRLIRLWDAIEKKQIPEPILSERMVREIIPISEALSQGYVINDKTWKRLEQAVDVGEIGAILQKSKGKQPRKGAISLVIDSKGFITAWEDGQAHHVGSLNYAEMDTDPVVKKSILRIKRVGIKDK